ncbi:hypothetical protein S245_028930 [Arachis hypogaea]
MYVNGSRLENLPEEWCCKRLQCLPELPLSIINLKVANSSTNCRPQDQECTSTSFQNVASLDEGKCIHLFRQSTRKLVHAYELRQKVGGRAIGWPRYLRIIYPDNRIPNWFTY